MRISDWSSDVCSSDLFAMAVRCIDDDQVAFRIYQRFGPLQPLVAHRRRGSHAQAAGSILRGLWISYSLFNILDRDEANAMIMPIDNQQLFDAPLMQEDRKSTRLNSSH